ncbi:MAG: IS4 family transposase [Fimbriiglobus sp.]|nr:IS4 family transposase [Fimbriiglobus sp.]
MDSWVERELAAGEFPDARLKTRLGQLLGDLGTRIGHTLPAACQDWAATKAAYRFFDNPRVDDQTILGGHFAATADRFAATTGTVLVLHDTTEFSFTRATADGVGVLSYVKGRHRTHTTCGVLMHSSLAVTTSGLPLGLAAVTFWTRKRFKGTNAAKRTVNPTTVPIEEKESARWLDHLTRSTRQLGDSARCVHVGDREADIFELFSAAGQSETHFLVRTAVDRLAGQGATTVAKLMRREPVRETHTVEVRDEHGNVSMAVVAVRFRRLIVHPSPAKRKRYGPLSLTAISAVERGRPAGREPIRWKLLTDLPVGDLAAAVEKLDWYAMRWKIETFHKVLKSGCHAEQAKLRTADRLVNLLAVLCVVGWRVFWLTMTSRLAPAAPPEVAFTPAEVAVLDRIGGGPPPVSERTVAYYLLAVAKLGGYLARTGDPPPGNMVVWRGLTRLADLLIGYELSG